ncbi:carbohydrate esterase family 3 protein [Sporormia fimetaria CBS 119925]|uniref:Carbohydrate esterase family 3 protein n=1 Tax=Sporormia fimetaria CBS 119925 TaxID=1340428 RepID=A0A6A6VLT7_9PLEO|nr:carbohydrate esterase family 3 protein [Sporormia fimetaria CBS 119925]
MASQAAAAAVKIMPLGASIVTTCWRATLWKQLKDAGMTNIDFVGTQKATTCAFPYDGEHEGRPGSLAIEYVQKNWLPGILSATKPDVVLVHLGTNDVIQRKNTPDIIAAYAVMIDQMRASNPRMHVLFSTLIPMEANMFGGAVTRIIELNEAIKKWAPGKSLPTSPIVVVDNFEGFDVATDTTDGEHPNAKGEAKMAAKFYTPLVQAIQQVNGRRLR